MKKMPISLNSIICFSRITNFPWGHPRQATIKVNRICNSSCVYCYAWKEHPSRKEAPLTSLLRVIEELAELGVDNISFTGGEPLMRSDLEQMANQAQKLGIRTGIITNGLMLFPERYDALYLSGTKYFNISLDTIDPTIYKILRGVPLERVLRNLLSVSQKIQENDDAFITLLCVVNRLNLSKLPELAYFAQTNNMRLMLQPIQSVTSLPKTRSDEHLQPWQFSQNDLSMVQDAIENLLSSEHRVAIGNPKEYLLAIPSYVCGDIQFHNTGCNVGYTDINIDENLSLKPCWRLPAIADLQENNLKTAWFSPSFAAARRNMKIGNCPSCWLLYRERL